MRPEEEREDESDTPTGQCRDLPWLCERCGILLGYVDRKTKTKIRIKRKDLYVWVNDPKGMGTACGNCGWLNELLDEKFEKELNDKKVSPGAAGARAC